VKKSIYYRNYFQNGNRWDGQRNQDVACFIGDTVRVPEERPPDSPLVPYARPKSKPPCNCFGDGAGIETHVPKSLERRCQGSRQERFPKTGPQTCPYALCFKRWESQGLNLEGRWGGMFWYPFTHWEKVETLVEELADTLPHSPSSPHTARPSRVSRVSERKTIPLLAVTLATVKE
jgi:hypothetical protein